MSDLPPEDSPEARFFRWIAQTMKWYAIEEMRKHRWHLSRAASRDLGMAACDDWEHRFWTKFCRWRLFEHIEGLQCWIELNGREFAVLKNVRVFNDLLDEMLKLMKDRKVHRDDLEMIQWAQSNPRICKEHVYQFLLVINVNSARDVKLPEEWKRIAAA